MTSRNGRHTHAHFHTNSNVSFTSSLVSLSLVTAILGQRDHHPLYAHLYTHTTILGHLDHQAQPLHSSIPTPHNQAKSKKVKNTYTPIFFRSLRHPPPPSCAATHMQKFDHKQLNLQHQHHHHYNKDKIFSPLPSPRSSKAACARLKNHALGKRSAAPLSPDACFCPSLL